LSCLLRAPALIAQGLCQRGTVHTRAALSFSHAQFRTAAGIVRITTGQVVSHRRKETVRNGLRVRHRTDPEVSAPQSLRMIRVSESLSASHPRDFQLTIPARRGLMYNQSNLLLAKACFDGTLELLTAAWKGLLGYAHHEFTGKTLDQIMEPGKPVANVIAAIFDERNPSPVELRVRSRDGQCKCLKLHRWFDSYERTEPTVFIMAEETPDSGRAPPAEPGGDVDRAAW
jgi:hypothetical protein